MTASMVSSPVVQRCACNKCRWSGPVADLVALEEQGIFDLVLPGDRMPLGLCPKCRARVHLPLPDEDLLRRLVKDAVAYEAAEFDGHGDLGLSPSDVVDWFTGWRERAKRVLKAGEPKTPRAAAERALVKLRAARDLMKAASAPRTVSRIRLAITSAGGAIRHAQGKESR